MCEDDDLAYCVSSYVQPKSKGQHGCVSLVFDITTSLTFYRLCDCNFMLPTFAVILKLISIAEVVVSNGGVHTDWHIIVPIF